MALLPGEAEARRPGRVFVAGLLVALAALVRQQAVLWLPAVAVVVWTAGGEQGAGRRARRVLVLGAGFGLPLLACLASFAALGAVGQLLYWTLTHNLGYAANPIAPAEALERAAPYLLPFLIVTAPLSWAGWRSRPLFGSRHARVFVTGLVLLSVPAAFVGFRFFPHYFIQLYLPLALAAAPWTAAALKRPLSGMAQLALAWPLALLAGFTVANLVLYRGPAHVYEETRPVFDRVASRLEADTCYGRGPLFVWGFAPQLYAEAGLPLAWRFVVPQASLTGYVPGRRARGPGRTDGDSLVRDDHWDLLMGDLERNEPVFILDTSPAGLHGWDRYPMAALPRLERFVEDSYRVVAAVEGVWVWRRKGCQDSIR